MPDPNLADISKRSRDSLRPDHQHWIVPVDASRLQKARAERVLSLRGLAAESGVSARTLARLETGQVKQCHRSTLFRIADALADEPLLLFWELSAADDVPALKRQLTLASQPSSSWVCSRTFAAQPDQVAQARAFLGRLLHGCPMADDAQVICSELFTNAIRHSRSARPGGKVTLRAEVSDHEYAWLEVEDQGGDWAESNRDGESGPGLEIVAALADYWTIRTRDPRRFVCVRLDWPDWQHQGGF